MRAEVDLGAAAARIRRLHEDQINQAAAVFSQSHAEYPSFAYIFPDPVQRRRALSSIFRGVTRDASALGTAYVAETPDGRVHGVALWLPPGAFPWSMARQMRFAPALVSVLLTAPRSFRAFMATGRNTERLHPPGSHWYLEALGVAPAAHGLGLGARLIAPVLGLADEQGSDCYLETADPANIPFYEKRGFHVEEKALALVPGGPTHTAMRRRAGTGPP